MGTPQGVGECLEWEKEDWLWAGNPKEAKISKFEPGLKPQFPLRCVKV